MEKKQTKSNKEGGAGLFVALYGIAHDFRFTP
jgi:hypothetical protein